MLQVLVGELRQSGQQGPASEAGSLPSRGGDEQEESLQASGRQILALLLRLGPGGWGQLDGGGQSWRSEPRTGEHQPGGPSSGWSVVSRGHTRCPGALEGPHLGRQLEGGHQAQGGVLRPGHCQVVPNTSTLLQ